MASFSHPCLSMTRQACHKNNFPQITNSLFTCLFDAAFTCSVVWLRSSGRHAKSHIIAHPCPKLQRLVAYRFHLLYLQCPVQQGVRVAEGAFNTELDQLIETSIEYTQSLSLNSSQSNYSTILLTQITFPFVGSYCSVTKAIWLLKNWILRQLCRPCRFHFFTSSSLSWGSTGHEKPVTLDTPSYPYITCLSSCLMQDGNIKCKKLNTTCGNEYHGCSYLRSLQP